MKLKFDTINLKDKNKYMKSKRFTKYKYNDMFD